MLEKIKLIDKMILVQWCVTNTLNHFDLLYDFTLVEQRKKKLYAKIKSPLQEDVKNVDVQEVFLVLTRLRLP